MSLIRRTADGPDTESRYVRRRSRRRLHPPRQAATPRRRAGPAAAGRSGRATVASPRRPPVPARPTTGPSPATPPRDGREKRNVRARTRLKGQRLKRETARTAGAAPPVGQRTAAQALRQPPRPDGRERAVGSRTATGGTEEGVGSARQSDEAGVERWVPCVALANIAAPEGSAVLPDPRSRGVRCERRQRGERSEADYECGQSRGHSLVTSSPHSQIRTSRAPTRDRPADRRPKGGPVEHA